MLVTAEQPENIYSILITSEVFNGGSIFNSFNEEQSWNIEAILVTFEVSKLPKFKILKELHLANKFFMLVTSFVSKLKVKEVKEEQP